MEISNYFVNLQIIISCYRVIVIRLYLLTFRFVYVAQADLGLRCPLIANGPFSCIAHHVCNKIQSTLVISNSKGLSEILRDIRTSTYQICRIEENIIGTTTFNKFICNWTLEIRDILKILWKRGETAPWEQFLLFSTIFFTCC